MAIDTILPVKKANCRIRLFLFILFLFFAHNLPAQDQIEGTINPAYQYFLNFQLDSCKQTLGQWGYQSPIQYYLKILYTSAYLFNIDNIEQFKNQKFKENELLEHLDDLNFTETYTTFLKSEIKLQWGILKLKNGEEFSAFWNFKQAYSLAKENIDKEKRLIYERKAG